LARIYARSLRSDFGRPSVDVRIVIGAMIIKHQKSLSDEETIEKIRENSYMQYFLGLKEFTHDRVFDPSLFVTLRKRMGQEMFDQMNDAFIARIKSGKQLPKSKKTVQARRRGSSTKR